MYRFVEKLLFSQPRLSTPLFSCTFASSSRQCEPAGDLLESDEAVKSLQNELHHRNLFGGLKRRRSVPNLPPVEGEIIFGIHPIQLALQASHRRIYRMYLKLRELSDQGEELSATDNIKAILKLGRNRNIPTSIVPVKVLDDLARHRPHQGVCLDASPIDYTKLNSDDLADLIQVVQSRSQDRPPVFLYLDKVLDVMNFGAVMRTAYYMGVDNVFVEEGRCAKLSPMASKASSGVLELMPVYQVADGKEFIQICQKNNFDVVGTCQPSKSQTETVSIMSIDHFQLTQPTVLILGNEGVGLATHLSALCNTFLAVPPRRILHEGVDSLNVSVAAAILLHSITRPKC